MKIRLKEEQVAFVVCSLARILFKTVRLRVEDPENFLSQPPDRPVIYTFWHNRILAITQAFLKCYPSSRKGVSVLTSPSYDGRLLAAVARGFGMGAVFGSSNKRAVGSLRESTGILGKGGDLAITPDGPRGPVYTLGPGVVYLAQRNEAGIVPIHAEFSRAFRLKTWDGFRIPFPFSTISVKIGTLLFVQPTPDEASFEKERASLENILRNEAD